MLRTAHQKIIQEHALFNGLDARELAQVFKKTKFYELKKDTYIFTKGDKAEAFFILLSGTVKLSVLSAEGCEKIINIIKPEHSFAEAIMFLEAKQYPLSASTLKDSSFLKIEAENYTNILRKSPKACFKIMAKLSQNLHYLIGEISNLTMHDGTYRLVNFLFKNLEERPNKPAQVTLSISKNILASYISVRPETLSRVFNKLSNEGLLEIRKNRIIILKPQDLKKIINY